MNNTILIVEDEFEILDSIKSILEDEEFTVITASDGKEALNMLKKYKPNLILSDIQMPNMNGIEFFNIVRSDYETKFTPFIFLTARTDLTSIRDALNLGADDYITKPFRSSDLLKAIQVRLEKKQFYDDKIASLRHSISMYIPHELRTPLVAILGYSQMIQSEHESLEKTEISEMAERIEWSANRLYNRIEKLLHFSDIEFLTNNPSVNGSDLSTQINDNYFIDLIQEHYFIRGFSDRIITSIQPAQLCISDFQLKLLLKEIIENSVKFSDKNTKINIDGRVTGNLYYFLIEDHGSGMQKEEIARIDAFTQFNREMYSQDGNGLGLVIAKKIVEMNKGHFSIISEAGKFTRVKIGLPFNLSD